MSFQYILNSEHMHLFPNIKTDEDTFESLHSKCKYYRRSRLFSVEFNLTTVQYSDRSTPIEVEICVYKILYFQCHFMCKHFISIKCESCVIYERFDGFQDVSVLKYFKLSANFFPLFRLWLPLIEQFFLENLFHQHVDAKAKE